MNDAVIFEQLAVRNAKMLEILTRILDCWEWDYSEKNFPQLNFKQDSPDNKGHFEAKFLMALKRAEDLIKEGK